MLVYYQACFLVSLILTMIYVCVWQKHFDAHITAVFLIIPIANLGALITASASTLEEAYIGLRFSHIGGYFGMLFVVLATLSLSHIKFPRFAYTGLFIFTTLIYLTSLSVGHSTIYYKSAELLKKNGVSYIGNKEYGFCHTLFYIMIFVYILLGVYSLIHSHRHKVDVSRKITHLAFFPVLICAAFFFIGRFITDEIELISVAYIPAQITYLLIAFRLGLYNINESGLVSLVEKGSTGFVSFDFKYRYLGCNETAEEFFPSVKALVVDETIEGIPEMENTAYKWLNEFVKDNKHCEFHYKYGESTYHVEVNYLYDGRRRRGYQLFITDDTTDVQFIELLNSFNEQLRDEVNEKTENIVKMHNNLIVGMATMVESRDNSTGGHIKRTSEGVRILVNEMRALGDKRLTDRFCENLIKAAPMHDLGKIAVDDAILRKPGRFEPEEFEKMKAHAPEGARIVNSILENVTDAEFHKLAVNVAHYHHERWDGSGYPEKLSGEDIPLEARIMAIADVYDALVSKRVYKDSMSFEKADSIIMEGMGSQFDPGLKEVYIAARPKLEAYYESLAEKDS